MTDWISVKDKLPLDHQAVLMRYNYTNHLGNFFCYPNIGKPKMFWQFDAGWIEHRPDEVGNPNNKRPYIWQTFGAMQFFGQDVTHWIPITWTTPQSEIDEYEAGQQESREFFQHAIDNNPELRDSLDAYIQAKKDIENA